MTQTPHPEDATVTRRSPRWMKLLLVGSLALNLTVLGLVAGAVWRFNDREHGPRVSAPLGIVLFRTLASEDRKALRAELGGQVQPQRMSRRAILIEIPTALRADPPDMVRLEAIIDSEVARHADWLTLSNDSWLAHVETMDVAARRAYADRLEAVMRDRLDHHGKPKPPHGHPPKPGHPPKDDR
ncbi:MAG: periplasmic heavy metal sensor [Marinibacterium sp.]|nr:periplasmic heavy metal sensor [Marinibacterium sp.]